MALSFFSDEEDENTSKNYSLTSQNLKRSGTDYIKSKELYKINIPTPVNLKKSRTARTEYLKSEEANKMKIPTHPSKIPSPKNDNDHIYIIIIFKFNLINILFVYKNFIKLIFVNPAEYWGGKKLIVKNMNII